MFGDQLSDVLNEMSRAFREKDDERRDRLFRKLKVSSIPETFSAINKSIDASTSGYIAASGPTWVDFYLLTIFDLINNLDTGLLADNAGVQNLVVKLKQIPQIVAWLTTKRPPDGNILKSRL
jgi:hypothetical protein